MKIMVKIENSISGKSLSLYVGNKRKVNKLMINLIEAGFTVNYEPRYISGNYENNNGAKLAAIACVINPI